MKRDACFGGTNRQFSSDPTSPGELPACMVGLTNIVNSVLTGAAVARGWEGPAKGVLERNLKWWVFVW